MPYASLGPGVRETILSGGFQNSHAESHGGWLQNTNDAALAYQQNGPDSADPSSARYRTALAVATALSVSVAAVVVSSLFEDDCHLLTVGPVKHLISSVYLALAWGNFPWGNLSLQAQSCLEPGSILHGFPMASLLRCFLSLLRAIGLTLASERIPFQ